LPAVPAPVAVSVDPKTTAFLVLDLTTAICQPNPTCTATLPAVSAFLKKARDAKMTVVYSTTIGRGGASNPAVLPELAPQSGEQTVAARADKFMDTDLDGILKKAGAKTLVMVGSAANGAVMYSAFHANGLGYTVVVAEDGISSGNPVATSVAVWQLLNQPGFGNADNKPLAENAVTLSRTTQITIK
jgi:nicotinamidase-related amidase